jgi:Spy/CpxP family protein refolding chaperone
MRFSSLGHLLVLLSPVGAMIAAAAVQPLAAQEHDHTAHASPYAGLENRRIKALGDEEIAALLEGEGMGFALAAELNGWPGPRHVLDMAEALTLTAEQRSAIEAVRDAMSARARELGAELVEQETVMDRRFAHAHLDREELERLTGAIAVLRGQLRAVHLQAHLETRALLDEAQRIEYMRLRGYLPGEPR